MKPGFTVISKYKMPVLNRIFYASCSYLIGWSIKVKFVLHVALKQKYEL